MLGGHRGNQSLMEDDKCRHALRFDHSNDGFTMLVDAEHFVGVRLRVPWRRNEDKNVSNLSDVKRRACRLRLSVYERDTNRFLGTRRSHLQRYRPVSDEKIGTRTAGRQHEISSSTSVCLKMARYEPDNLRRFLVSMPKTLTFFCDGSLLLP